MNALRAAGRALHGAFGSGWVQGVNRTTVSVSAPLAALRPAQTFGGLSLGIPMAIGQLRMMRHGMRRRKLGRNSKERWHLMRNQVTDLIKHERIMTTLAKAKELRRVADWMVTLGKNATVHDRVRVGAIVRTAPEAKKVFDELAVRYKDRNGGYTRVLRYRENRKGDNAPMAFIEYVDRPGELRDTKPPATQLPYSKVLKRAEEKGDTELVEYYKNLQEQVVAAHKSHLERKKSLRSRYHPKDDDEEGKELSGEGVTQSQ